MSVAGDAVCEGWLRKSPPEKKLRRYAWKRRWFVLRSGRLSGEPDVLQYYKNPQSRRPIRTIDLNLCEQVDAGLSFTKKELESSFVFDLRTEERTWYLVAESEEDMNRWVTSICLLCGFNPTEDVSGRTSSSSINSNISMVTGLVPPPYDPVRVRRVERDGSVEDNYLWLSHCQSHINFPLGSSTSLETDFNDNLFPSSSSSSSSSPSMLASSLPPSTSCFRMAPWTLTSPLSVTPDLHQKRNIKPRCHPSPHPRKHSLDFLRPVAITLSNDKHNHPTTTAGYQIPRPSTPQPPCRLTSTPSVDSMTQAELHTSTLAPPPRPPKPLTLAAHGELSGVGPSPTTLPRPSSTETEQTEDCEDGGNTIPAPGQLHGSCDSFQIPQSMSDRASMFEFSESFNSYFFNKGMVPLGSVCSEDDDVDENYVPMSAATTEPPIALRAAPNSSAHRNHANYVPMTAGPAPSSGPGDPPSLGKQIPPPAHMGFRKAPLTAAVPNTMSHTEATPPPIHRNLKPQRVKPAPLDMTSVLDWQEVPPPVRSPVTRTFTRDPSSLRSARPSSGQSSSPSSDSDDPDDNYVAMTTSSLSISTKESSLRLTLHRTSEGGVSGLACQRLRRDKQVEYLDLDLHTSRTSHAPQKRSGAEGERIGERPRANEERARGGRARVDYVVVDPKRTKALRNTREAWHDGRKTTEKEK
ncbi:GRB2-associated-binding protein 1-like [Gouania willdenowi]|uniref:GRB2-associated-binding protein 1-like n=1 Tax=Gouania willdenowi TaxID=441366 RepID=UPI0010544329|nr:GRB2-associated-binding protein 1-like [Gouania willdenowi]